MFFWKRNILQSDVHKIRANLLLQRKVVLPWEGKGCKVVRRKCIFLTWKIFWDYAGRPQEDVMLNFKPDLGRYFDFDVKNIFASRTIYGSQNFSQISFYICIQQVTCILATKCAYVVILWQKGKFIFCFKLQCFQCFPNIENTLQFVIPFFHTYWGQPHTEQLMRTAWLESVPGSHRFYPTNFPIFQDY